MRIILCEITHAHQAVKRTGKLMAMDQSKFTHAQWQITIAVLMRTIDKNTPRAVHWLNRIIFLINLGKIHIFLVMIPMPGLFP